MRVVLDGVFNHTGRGFWPFHHILETGAASPYRDWFHARRERLDGGRPLLDAYPPLGRADRRSHGYEAWWGLPALPKLNTDNPEVREYLCRVAEHWLRFGIDGWRLDVPQRDRRRGVLAGVPAPLPGRSGPDAYLVGEIWEVAPEWLRGDRFDALMNYPLAEAILGFAGGPHARHGRRAPRTTSIASSLRPLDGPAFADRVDRARCGATTRTSSPSSSTCSARTTRRGCGRSLGGDVTARPAGDAAPDDAARARRRSTTATRSACRGGNDPANRGAFPWDRGRWDAGPARLGPGADRASGRPSRRSAHGPLRVVGARVRRVAFERGVGARLRRRGQRRRRARRPAAPGRVDGAGRRRRTPRLGRAARRSAPSRARPIVDGRATIGSRPRVRSACCASS